MNLRNEIQQRDYPRKLATVGRIALVCIAKDEDRYIEEWIEYHLKLGVDSIYIYENDWRSNLGWHEQIDTIPFDGKHRQVYAYNHWLFSSEAEYFDWAIFIDVDEFIVLKQHSSIQEFLYDYGNIPDGVDAIAMNWMMFGDSGVSESEGSVLERFTRRGAVPERHIKSIVRLNGDRMMLTTHNTFGFWIDTNGKIGEGQNNFDGSNDVIQINHYYCKTKDEFKRKMNRGRADCGLLWNEWDFDQYNQNEVEDLTALNFIKR
jgi:hypothetical protein